MRDVSPELAERQEDAVVELGREYFQLSWQFAPQSLPVECEEVPL